jgi:hypothetical protein
VRQKIIPAVLAVLAAAGCGSAAGGQASPAASSPAPASSPDSSSSGPGGVPVAATAIEGRPFTVAQLAGSVPVTWRLALDSVACGTGRIFSPRVLAADAASTGEPSPPVPVPEPGMQFCLVKFSAVNEGDSRQPWMASGSALDIGADAYQPDVSGPGWSPSQAYMQQAQPHYRTADFGLNPHAGGVSWAVYEIPARAHPSAVSVPAGQATPDGAQVLVMLRA